MRNRSEIAFEQKIFHILRAEYSEGVARAAAAALFWSQYAENCLRGRLGIYKTDAELGSYIGRHGKTAGRNLMSVCAAPNFDDRSALFEVDYGPLPGQHAGRCRWLFITERGHKVICEARELALQSKIRKEIAGNIPRGGSRTIQPIGSKCSDRSAHNDLTLKRHYTSNTLPENLSSTAGRKEISDGSECRRLQDEQKVIRFAQLWNEACSKNQQEGQKWDHAEIMKNIVPLSKVVGQARVIELKDVELEARLVFLISKRHLLKDDMGERFNSYNRYELSAQSFGLYGTRLLDLAGEKLKSKIVLKPMLSASDL